jgi:hypothetical protein
MDRFSDLAGVLRNTWKIARAALSATSLTAARTYTLPDASGTLALTSQLSVMAPQHKVTQGGNGPYTLPSTPDGRLLIVFGDGMFIDGSNYSLSGSDVTFSMVTGAITDYTDLVFIYTEAP